MANPSASFREREVYASAVFAVNQQVFDEAWVIAPLALVRELYDYTTEATALEVRLHDRVDEQAFIARLQARLGDGYRISDRLQQQASAYTMLQIEKWITFLILLFILLIATFNVIGSLSMLIIDKQADIRTLHNLGALMSAITYFHNPKLFNISYRKMTVSTCGLVPGIRSLGELDLGIRLAVSLVSADDETRSRIMRVNRTYPLSELKKALIAFQHTCDKRITLEYCMLGGVNTTPEAAKDLASFTAGLFSVVNLIPWNPIEGMEWRTPDAQEIRSFTSQLDRLRVNYTLRMPKGRGISGACGQLATSSRREPSVSSSRRRP